MTATTSAVVQEVTLDPHQAERQFATDIAVERTRLLYQGSLLPTLFMLLNGLVCAGLLWSPPRYWLVSVWLVWLLAGQGAASPRHGIWVACSLLAASLLAPRRVEHLGAGRHHAGERQPLRDREDLRHDRTPDRHRRALRRARGDDRRRSREATVRGQGVW